MPKMRNLTDLKMRPDNFAQFGGFALRPLVDTGRPLQQMRGKPINTLLIQDSPTENYRMRTAARPAALTPPGWGRSTGICRATSFDDPEYYEFEARKSRAGASAFKAHRDFIAALAAGYGSTKLVQGGYDAAGKAYKIPGQSIANKVSGPMKVISWPTSLVLAAMAMIDAKGEMSENERAKAMQALKIAVEKECAK